MHVNHSGKVNRMKQNCKAKVIRNSAPDSVVHPCRQDGELPALNEVYVCDGMWLFNNDCLDVIPRLQDESIDLVVCSPPYNVDLGRNKYNKKPYDHYDDNKEHAEYITWLETVFRSLYSKLREGGRVCIIIGDAKNGRVSTHSDIIQFMTRIGHLKFGHLIWNKDQVGNRRGWGSWCSPSCPSFPTPFEHILLFAKATLKLQTKGMTDLTPEEFKPWTLAHWHIAPENRMQKIGHPAMCPVEIPYRLIKMLSWVGATVLDPFNGAGTSGLACQKLDREYIGIELSKKYCEISIERWKSAKKAAA